MATENCQQSSNNLAYVSLRIGLSLTAPIRFLQAVVQVVGHRQTWQHVGIHPKRRPEKSKSLNSAPENKLPAEIAFQIEIQPGGGDLIKE